MWMKLGWSALALGLFGCGDGGSEDPPKDATVDAAPMEDMQIAPDAAPSEQARIAAYCEARANAQCEWAFDCLQGSGTISSVLGLGGPTVADCAQAVATKCTADATDRAERGTLFFSPDATDACVAKLAMAPCLPADPLEWVSDWNKYVHQSCNGVIRGTQAEGDPCVTHTDCQTLTHICANETCRPPIAADIMIECEAQNEGRGAFNPDPMCPGEICVQLGANQEEITGICSTDCRTGFGCPGGSYCLQFRVGQNPPNFFCTQPCTDDEDCENGLTCRVINSDNPDTKHCFVTPPE